MTQRLETAPLATDFGTKPTKTTKPAPTRIEGLADKAAGGVLSVSSVLSEEGWAEPAPPARADKMVPCLKAYLALLHDHGQATHDALASTRGSETFRAWQTGTTRREPNLIDYENGKAVVRQA